jgi:asparagine synthase (glutamine-hydrolysing)
MVASMEHEAFYASGTYSAPELGVYTGWVAHEGSFAASQPFLNETGDVALLFSGECFIDPEARRSLTRNGHGVGKHTADWLVQLYEEEGDQFFGMLNGLFSGLLIDKRRRKIFLFNDRYGVERIYWHQATDALYFASEAKALLRIVPKLREFDLEGVAQFLTYGCTLDWRTLFRGVELLPGGSIWSFEAGNCRKTKYFSPREWESQPLLSAEDFESKFQETFGRVLPSYFESTPRVGISLTGGLDSRMIMACRPETGENPICYTFSGEEGQTLDDRLAAEVANACALEHRLLRLGSDFFSDFATHADRTVYITDGYLGILGAHEIYLNKEARQLATVRLTGNFGSEILRGVSTFKPAGLTADLINAEVNRTLETLSQSVVNDNGHRVTLAAFREIPWSLFGSLAAARSQTIFRTPYLDNQIVALAYQAPENLSASPVSAVRLIRNSNPALSNIPADLGQMGGTNQLAAALKRLFCRATFKIDYLNNEGFPHWLLPLDPLLKNFASGLGILGLHKYLHYRRWFRRELSGYLSDVLTRVRTWGSPFWNSGFVAHMVAEHIQGRKNYVMEINAVLTLEAIERLLFRDMARATRDLECPHSEDSRKKSLLSR